jgi:hypothetical protein
MTVEADIFTALGGLVANRVFPDVAPIATARPYITYSQIGGRALTYLENAVPSKQNGRFQINVWANTRASASATMLLVESAMVSATAFQARPQSAPSTGYDNDMLVYTSLQDFSVWSTR